MTGMVRLAMNGFLWVGVACTVLLAVAVLVDGLDESIDVLDFGPGWLVGIMMPVVLFPADMFPGFFPTLEAQYVLKDVILVAAAAVVAAKALGARYVLAPE